MNQIRQLMSLLESIENNEHNLDPSTWDKLTYLKDKAVSDGKQLASSGYQLYVPIPQKNPLSSQEKRRKAFSYSSQWDNECNMKTDYEKYVSGNNDISPNGMNSDHEMNEAAPIIGPSRSNVPPGRNKPHAQLWTSTAIKNHNGTWTSDWVDWCEYEMPEWISPKGYLYKVKPGARVLYFSEDMAEDLYRMFNGKSISHPVSGINDFPWDKINNHFDAVHIEKNKVENSYGFTYGWDVESTAWFDPSFLTLVGEVPINSRREDNSWEDNSWDDDSWDDDSWDDDSEY